MSQPRPGAHVVGVAITGVSGTVLELEAQR